MAQDVRTCALAIRPAAAVVLCAGLALPAFARRGDERGPYSPWIGSPGVVRPIQELLALPATESAEIDVRAPRRASSNPLAPLSPQWPWDTASARLPARQPPWDSPQTIGLNFTAALQTDPPGRVPPSPSGAAGIGEVGVFVDGRLYAFDKATGSLLLSLGADQFFDPVRAGVPTSRPRLRFDPTSGRWIMAAVTAAASSNHVLLAVSAGSSLSASSVFTFFEFQQDQVAPVGNGGQAVADLSLGVDANAVYLAGDMFAGTTFVNTSAWVVNKASLLGPGPVMATAFRNLIVAGSGPFAPRGVDNPDPLSGFGFFIGVDNAQFGLLQIRRVTNPGGAPSLSGNLAVAVPATTFPIDVPSNGGSPLADSLDDRLFDASCHRNRWNGRSTLVTAHNIQVNSAGVASNTGGRNGSRWYQITNLDTSPALEQAGTLFDPAPTNPRSYWIPSAAMSGQGHLAIGASSAAASTWIGCSAAGRLASDPAGATQPPTLITPGGGSYINNQGWFGATAVTCVDPVDDQSLWTFHEFMPAHGVWGVRAARLVAPPPLPAISANPPTVVQGQSGVQVQVTAAGGLFDTGPGLSRFRAQFTGTGISITNIALTDPSHATLTLDIAPGANLGPRGLTLVNPDGQQAVSPAPVLSVLTGQVCPVIDQDPQAAAVCEGGIAGFHIAAHGTPAPTYQWRRDQAPLTDGGAVQGATTDTLSIDPVQAGDAGSYDCIVTNACGSATSAAAELTINSAPVITNQSSTEQVSVGSGIVFLVDAPGATAFQWLKDGVPLTDGGQFSGVQANRLTISPASLGDSGLYTCRASNSCGSATTRPAELIVVHCLANCDDSTIPPALNVLDFVCFLNLYAADDPSANCDNSTTEPILNVLDFSCFINAYAAGCS